MEVIRTSSFWRDLKEILDYIDKGQSESRAVRFIDAVDETIDSVEELPDLGSPWESAKPRQQSWRFYLVKELRITGFCIIATKSAST
jgi:plasmid stabilization system protein ParE